MICSHELKSIIEGLIKSTDETKTYYTEDEYRNEGRISGLEAALGEIEKLEKESEEKQTNTLHTN